MQLIEGECYVWHQCFAPHYGVAGFVKASRRSGGNVVLAVYQNAACVLSGADSYSEIVAPCDSCINNVHIACEPYVGVPATAAARQVMAAVMVLGAAAMSM
jgi:hypothetical protein